MSEWKLLGPEGSIYRTLDLISDFLIWSMLWVICSLPIITIGAATCALNAVSIQRIRSQDSSVKMFFREFYKNLLFGTLWELVTAVLVVVCYLWYWLFQQYDSIPAFLEVLVFALVICLFSVMLMVLPTKAVFSGKIAQIIKIAVFLTLRAPYFPALKLFAYALPITLVLRFSYSVGYWIFPLLLLGGIGAGMYFLNLTYWKIVKKQGFVKKMLDADEVGSYS